MPKAGRSWRSEGGCTTLLLGMSLLSGSSDFGVGLTHREIVVASPCPGACLTGCFIPARPCLIAH
jgi:hypothetical protein